MSQEYRTSINMQIRNYNLPMRSHIEALNYIDLFLNTTSMYSYHSKTEMDEKRACLGQDHGAHIHMGRITHMNY